MIISKVFTDRNVQWEVLKSGRTWDNSVVYGLSHESLDVTGLGPYSPPQVWWEPINNPRVLIPTLGTFLSSET